MYLDRNSAVESGLSSIGGHCEILRATAAGYPMVIRNLKLVRASADAEGSYEATLDDSALVDGLRCRDPAAVRYLSETCLPSVWRFACVRLKADRHVAEDIVSEAVLALLKAVADPSVTIESPMSWLRTVVANKVVDHFRAAARVQHLIDQVNVSLPLADTSGTKAAA